MTRSALRRLRPTLILAAIAANSAPSTARGQDLISIPEIMAIEVRAPTARIQYGAGELQFGKLRLPDGPGPHPVVVFIHGGCWLSQFDITHAAALEQGITDAGYGVWSLEYRRVGNSGGGWPGTFLDVAQGVDHLRALANDYPLDLNRVIAAGHSAGGQFALWVAARSRIDSTSDVFIATPLQIHGVLALAPAPDLRALHEADVCGGVVDRLMGGSPLAVGDRYEAASPMQLLPVGVPQRLIVGAHDEAWGPSGRAYFERARADGRAPVSLREAPESGHFDVIAPSTTTWTLVLEELEMLSNQISRAASGPR